MPRRLLALGGLAVGALACDPNVVIGAKWRTAEPVAGSTGVGATAGSGATSTSGSGGSAGSGGSGEGGTAAAAAGGTTAEAGTPGAAGADDSDILFQADHEDGSLAVWDEGPDADAGGYYADAAAPQFSDEHTRTGTGAAEVTIDTSSGDTISRLYRRVTHDKAYYSAWFYLLEDHVPSRWWSIFLFRAVQDRSESIDLWDVDLIREDDRLTFSIYDHQRGDVLDVPSKPTIPIQEWFHLEAYLELGPGTPSRIDYWLNGEPFLSLPDLEEAPAGEPVYWVIGNGGSTLDPPVSTIYVDDAIISASRVGVP